MNVNYKIDYKKVEDLHVFTCKELPGLLIAHKDYKTAYDDVPLAIEKLIELDKR